MAVNMHDVARLADVSQRTVSNVVNGYPHVRPETRARVEQAIAALRYRPNISAQRLRQGRTGMVALAIPEIGAPYFSELADYVQRRAVERGVTLLIDQTGGSRDRELLVLDGYRSNIIDGLIFSPLSVTASDLDHGDLDFPTVLLGESIDNGGVVHVSIDNIAAAEQATNHLISTGRRFVAAVGAHPEFEPDGPAVRRIRGYQQAMAAAGIPVTPELNWPSPKWTRAAGYQIATRIAEGARSIDGLFCFNDSLALGAIKGFQDHGVRVPDDVAVIGWDDIEEASYSTPTLSTVVPDKRQIARLAVDHLLDRIEDRPLERTEILADFHLALRESTEASNPQR